MNFSYGSFFSKTRTSGARRVILHICSHMVKALRSKDRAAAAHQQVSLRHLVGHLRFPSQKVRAKRKKEEKGKRKERNLSPFFCSMGVYIYTYTRIICICISVSDTLTRQSPLLLVLSLSLSSFMNNESSQFQDPGRSRYTAAQLLLHSPPILQNRQIKKKVRKREEENQDGFPSHTPRFRDWKWQPFRPERLLNTSWTEQCCMDIIIANRQNQREKMEEPFFFI